MVHEVAAEEVRSEGVVGTELLERLGDWLELVQQPVEVVFEMVVRPRERTLGVQAPQTASPRRQFGAPCFASLVVRWPSVTFAVRPVRRQAGRRGNHVWIERVATQPERRHLVVWCIASEDNVFTRRQLGSRLV